MMKKNIISLIGCCLTLIGCCLTLMGCSHIDEHERLIYVKPVDVQRAVLIEDFTGQRCVNCPNATDEIARLQAEYGSDNVIAVAIHSGPLAFYTNSRFLGLRTETGDAYYDYWSPELQPIGTVNRQGLSEYVSWSSKIREELRKKASVDIAGEAVITDGRLVVKTSVTGVSGHTTGQLQLWVTENDITAFQMMPDGTRNDSYVHNHVFRAAVNGTWGEAVSVAEGATVTREHSLPLGDDWNADNLEVVVFVYNDAGIANVKRFYIK